MASPCRACVVPKCSCNVYRKPSIKPVNRLLANLITNCSKCGHYSQLHRNFSSKDGLIIDEIKAASLKPCNSLIPMSHLHSNPMFDSYTLIPISTDNLKNKDGLCTCKGFSANDIAKTLLHFNKLSYNETINELPSLSCDQCTHLLINHQSDEVANYQYSNNAIVFESVGSLINIQSCDNNVIICMITKDDENWTLLYKSLDKQQQPQQQQQQPQPLLYSDISKGMKRPRTDSIANNKELIEQIKSCLTDKTHTITIQLIDVPLYLCCVNDIIIISGLIYINVFSRDIQTNIITNDYTINIQLSDLINSVTLSPNGSHVSVTTSNGFIKLWTLKDYRLVDTKQVSQFSITCCEWDSANRYLFIGTETGDIICYCINNNTIIYSNSICFGSVNCIKWITVLRSIAIGSNDGRVYIISLKSESDSSNNIGPIDKYFNKERKEKFILTTILQGHRSFISSICIDQGNLLSIGWDGVILVWLLSSIVINDDNVIEDEPCTAYTIGKEYNIKLLPVNIWIISDNMLSCLYKTTNNTFTLVFYY